MGGTGVIVLAFGALRALSPSNGFGERCISGCTHDDPGVTAGIVAVGGVLALARTLGVLHGVAIGKSSATTSNRPSDDAPAPSEREPHWRWAVGAVQPVQPAMPAMPAAKVRAATSDLVVFLRIDLRRPSAARCVPRGCAGIFGRPDHPLDDGRLRARAITSAASAASDVIGSTGETGSLPPTFEVELNAHEDADLSSNATPAIPLEG